MTELKTRTQGYDIPILKRYGSAAEDTAAADIT